MPWWDQAISLFLWPASECWTFCPGFGSKMASRVPDILSPSDSVQREVHFSLHISFPPGGKLYPEALLQTAPHTSLARTCPSIKSHWQVGIELLLLAYANRDMGRIRLPRSQCTLILKQTQVSYWQKERVKCLLGSKQAGLPLILLYIHLHAYMQVYS